ncbi:hypothetical protein OT109_07290 [Phycisphaeraceae bacterium D3-23]
MLIVLNIIIIIFLLAMVAIWATYGFFSAFIHLMIVIVSGTFAFAVWEPLSYWLLGRMPATAWGVGLLVPFVLSIVVLRIVFDKYCKMNLKFPRLADQAGGAACGLGAGVLSAGMLLMGAGFLMPSDIMGFQPYTMVRNTVDDNDDGKLWPITRVDEWTGSFFTMLSTGSMRPWSDTSLAHYKSDIAARAQIHHLTSDPNQSKSSPPASVDLLTAQVITDPDEYIDMVVFASFEALINPDQIDLDQIHYDTPEADWDIYGGHLVDGILKEFEARREVYADLPEDEQNADTRPTAIFNLNAMVALADKFKVPERGSSGRSTSGPIAVPQPGSQGGGRAPGGRDGGRTRGADGETPGDGTETTPGDDAAVEADAAAEAAEDAAVATGGSPLNDLVAFFDDVIEKQVQPTVDAIEPHLRSGGQVVIVDTQWFKKPAGSFDSDGWLRVAIPSVRLVSRRDIDGSVEVKSTPPMAYSLEVNQNTGERIYIDLIGQSYYSAFAQVDAVKLGWVFLLPPGHGAERARFEVRQLGFDLDAPIAAGVADNNAAGEIDTFWNRVAMVGAIDVKPQAAPPEGIQVGDTSAVVALGERLPRSMSPNSATSIEPDKEDEPWTAFSGRQASVLRGNTGGRNSQMRAVTVADGARLIQVILTPDADSELLTDARQGNLAMAIRDTNGASHGPIGFVLEREDDSLNVNLRPRTEITAGDLPPVGTGDELTIYFQVPVGVTVTGLVLGETSSDNQPIPFAEQISVVDQ